MVKRGPGNGDIGLPCKGDTVDTGKWHLKQTPQPQTIVFHSDGRCNLTNVWFDPSNTNNQFSTPAKDPNDPTAWTSTYDGKAIPDPGYYFKYENDFKEDGNGGGIVKN
jgi:hypothetical protein